MAGPGHFPWGVNQNKMKQPFTILRYKFDLSYKHYTTSKYIITHNGKHRWQKLVQYQVALFGIQSLIEDKKAKRSISYPKKNIPIQNILKLKKLPLAWCMPSIYNFFSKTLNMWREGAVCAKPLLKTM